MEHTDHRFGSLSITNVSIRTKLIQHKKIPSGCSGNLTIMEMQRSNNSPSGDEKRVGLAVPHTKTY